MTVDQKIEIFLAYKGEVGLLIQIAMLVLRMGCQLNQRVKNEHL